jgi:hypothetical protein
MPCYICTFRFMAFYTAHSSCVIVACTGIPQIKNKKIKSVREADTTILNSDS